MLRYDLPARNSQLSGNEWQETRATNIDLMLFPTMSDKITELHEKNISRVRVYAIINHRLDLLCNAKAFNPRTYPVTEGYFRQLLSCRLRISFYSQRLCVVVEDFC